MSVMNLTRLNDERAQLKKIVCFSLEDLFFHGVPEKEVQLRPRGETRLIHLR